MPKLTFFSFPLKDVAKCKLWSTMAGCENANLKHQYLCENHFNTIYISNTPRRTVLLPNAVPYRWDENIDGNKDDGGSDGDGNNEYNLGKQASTTANPRDELLLEPLMRVDDENDIIYTESRQQQNHSIELLDEIVEDDGGDDGNEIIMNVNTKSQKQKSGASGLASAPTTNLIKIDDLRIARKKVMILQQPQKQQKHRMSLQSPGEFMGHVTKRQKINKDVRSPIDQGRMIDSKKSIEYNNGEAGGIGTDQDEDGSAGEGDNGSTDDTPALEQNIPIDDTANNPDIATFILKGEEFIQMPKRIYLAQRAQFMYDLKRYRSIIHNIKNQVNSIN